MTILLLGKTGQVGWELRRTLGPLGDMVAPGREEMYLARPDSISAFVRSLRPNLIVNAAAYTTVDLAESEPELAMAVNGTAPGVLAEEADRLGIPLVHYSTDYVFDGSKSEPYTECDEVNPISVYGKTKLAGEQAIQSTAAAHLILRTSWVYGTRGKNFLRTILRLARERESLRVVNDQVGAPTWSRMIAEATAFILSRCTGRGAAFSLAEVGGIYHLTAAESTSWYGFAKAIIEADPHKEEQILESILQILTADYPTPAARPANSRLDCSLLQETFGIQIVDWLTDLKLALDELKISRSSI